MKRTIPTHCLMAIAAGSAQAATLITPAVQVGEAGQAVCSLLNTTERDIPLARWQLVFDDGRVLKTFPGTTLRAGFTLQLEESAGNAKVGTGLWHCRAELAGSPRKVRLSQRLPGDVVGLQVELGEVQDALAAVGLHQHLGWSASSERA